MNSTYATLDPAGSQIALSVEDKRATDSGAAARGAILIVDDEDLICRTYCEAFEDAGYRTLVARSGRGIMSVLRDENIRTVFLDIFMPDGDGLEALMSIKRASPETIVIAMSGGNANYDYLDAAMKLGADGIIRKPAPPTVLLDMLAKLSPLNTGADNAERRKFERIRMDLPGRLFEPVDWKTVDCRVLNLGAGGALIECESGCPAELPLVLYVEHFGRFEGTIVHRSSTLFGMKFSVGEAKRGRLREMLASYAEHGTSGLLSLRKYPRFKSDGSVTLVRESGRIIACDVLDISPDGVSLRTADFPPIGELVRVGKSCGRVVRHHDEGIALQFIREPSETRK